MDVKDVLCKGTSMDGKPCTRHRTPGADVCKWHSPESVEKRAQALEAQAAAVRLNASVSA